MNGMELAGEYTSALTTFAGLGAALILERSGARHVRLGWTNTTSPRLKLTAEGEDDATIADTIHQHAKDRAMHASWLHADLEGDPWAGANAVFSPRIKSAAAKSGKGAPTPSSAEIAARWQTLQKARYEGIDQELATPGRDADLELIGALGEPAYWRIASNGPRPDEGASRWEMKTRNRGEDFVGNRLRGLARIVAKREPATVLSGLTGRALVDEAYAKNRSDESRTATGLTAPRFTDSALAWCGLWGIASFPVIHRFDRPSVTAGAFPVGRFMPAKLVLPVLTGAHSLGRWRAVIVSEQLARCAEADATKESTAQAWLVAHGVEALVAFQVNVSDNPNAPERYLGEGTAIPLR
ncbi:MAG: hypothetical protein E7Z95_03045 [Actinomyces succiniciruminis]|nr:hypothetical protein [Actinomyces succiniciruminis]